MHEIERKGKHKNKTGGKIPCPRLQIQFGNLLNISE